MRAISFSLYGAKSVYLCGMAVNCHEMPRLYGPGWTVVVHHDSTVPRPCLDYFRSLPDVRLVDHDGDGLVDGQKMFWRFFDMDPKAGYTEMLTRDADSRPYLREVRAVEEWLATDAVAHCIRDSLSHDVELMGGLSGFRCLFPDVEKNIRAWLSTTPSRPAYGWDQQWLRQSIWPMVDEATLHHGEYMGHPLTAPIETVHCGAPEGARNRDEEDRFGIIQHIKPYCED